jgi:hypothetical protein
MARFTNKDTQDQGTGQSSADLLKEQGLVEPGASGIGQPTTIMPKTTATSGTNIALPVLMMPDKNDFAMAQQDELIDPSFRGKNTLIRTGQNTWTYYGPQLVTENGRLSGGTYSSDGSDIASEFFSVRTAAERQTMISTAQKLGLFYGSKPSGAMMSGTGLDASDQRAVQALLDFSVRNKLTWRAVAAKLSSGDIAPSAGGGGSGGGYSVVSTEDAMESVREEFFRVLKRPPTPAEARQAAINIQQAERSRATGGSMDPTSLGVAAREQATKAAPGEFAANSAGSAMTRIFALLGGQ